MSIEFAILGALQYEALTGYELKKIFQEASFMYWSGNNNQVYKALLSLQEKGYTTSDLEIQLQNPSRKRYSTTEQGTLALKSWLLSEQEPPQLKKPILIQLCFSRGLSPSDLIFILNGYEKQLENQLVMQQNSRLSEVFKPFREGVDKLAWALVNENIERSLAEEIAWVKDAQRKITHYIQER